MTLNQIETWFNNLLVPEKYPMDPSRNGIQVSNSAPDTKEITTAAYAVDACLETISRAAAAGAGLLLVHHGLLWGQCAPLTGSYYRRIAALMQADMALYACHIPLDAHPEIGNNAQIAGQLGLQDMEPFGYWRGAAIGCIGNLPQPLAPHAAAEKLFGDSGSPAAVLPFGPDQAKRVAIISGGAGEEVDQAIAAHADLYITGEIGHENYHTALENGISVIGGGHYRTETFGVSAAAQRFEKETGVRTIFIDVPTGL